MKKYGEREYCVFSQYYDEYGNLITLQDGGVHAFNEEKIENAFAVGPYGKIEDVEIIQDYGCDCTCYEVRLKKNHQKIAYYTVASGGVWFDSEPDLPYERYQALASVLIPFVIEVIKPGYECTYNEMLVPKSFDELFYRIISGHYSSVYYFSGYRKLDVCGTHISFGEDGYELEIISNETGESVFRMDISFPDSMLKQIKQQ